jgi:cell division protein FtsQ
MVSIDPRLAERRRVVAEDRARHKISRLLKWFLIVAVIGSVVWLALSPALSVGQVTAVGIVQSSTHGVLAEQGVRAGTPMILIGPSRVEAALEEDPWVATANVVLHWPDTVIVEIEERTPVAWVETQGGWVRRASDGVALPSSPAPDDTLARVHLPEVTEEEAASHADVLGAVEFVAALPEELRLSALLTTEANGEIWAEVAGYQVRLGRPIEMTAKALSLTALLRESPDPESTLTLIAPTHPAVTPATSVSTPRAGSEVEEDPQP